MNEFTLRKIRADFQGMWQDLPDDPTDPEAEELATALSTLITRVSVLIENKGKASRRVKSARMKRRT